MKLLFIRHAYAGDNKAWRKKGRPDELRPLTNKGRKEFRLIVKKLYKMDRGFSVIYSSPYIRAKQTANLLTKKYRIPIEETQALLPTSSHKSFAKFVRSLKNNTNYIFVGHEPNLSQFVCYLLTGETLSFIDFPKGGALLLESIHASRSAKINRRKYKIKWFIAPNFSAGT